MLLGKNGSRYQIDYLLPFLNRLERGADGDLCLTVPYIPADQTVHDLRALHIMLCILNSLELVLCLLKGKHLLEFFLPDRVRPIDKSF